MNDDVQRDAESLPEERPPERSGQIRLSAEEGLHHLLQEGSELFRSQVRCDSNELCTVINTCDAGGHSLTAAEVRTGHIY